MHNLRNFIFLFVLYFLVTCQLWWALNLVWYWLMCICTNKSFLLVSVTTRPDTQCWMTRPKTRGQIHDPNRSNAIYGIGRRRYKSEKFRRIKSAFKMVKTLHRVARRLSFFTGRGLIVFKRRKSINGSEANRSYSFLRWIGYQIIGGVSGSKWSWDEGLIWLLLMLYFDIPVSHSCILCHRRCLHVGL